MFISSNFCNYVPLSYTVLPFDLSLPINESQHNVALKHLLESNVYLDYVNFPIAHNELPAIKAFLSQIQVKRCTKKNWRNKLT